MTARRVALAVALLLGAAAACAAGSYPQLRLSRHLGTPVAYDPPSVKHANKTAHAHVDDDSTLIENSGPDDQTDGSDSDRADTRGELAADATQPYTVTSIAPSRLGLKPPELPDLSGYTPGAARAKVHRHPRGTAYVASMLKQNAFQSFTSHDGRLRIWASRQRSLPKAIYISGGYVTPRDLARQLPSAVFAETSPGVYVARLPIDIKENATLHIGKDVKDFRLSLDRGSFLVNQGRLFITGSKLEAWDETHHAPAKFRDEHDFRPFLISWGGSATYIVNSTIAHLGYAASKAYGVSISQYSPAMAPIMRRPEPTGWIINSTVYDNWYGFYCYHANHVVLAGNTFRDNIKYGVDPHDFSHDLIIARNNAYGTKIKHGIIVSRSVDHSWIFDNRSHDNTLSGIVIDRSSTDDVVADNRVYRNHGDGITIYESPRTLIWRNLAVDNKRQGIRVRNSVDVRIYDNIAIANGDYGIYGDVEDLTGTGRNLRLDPFYERVSMVVVGGKLVSNAAGPLSIDRPLSLEVYNVAMLAPQRSLGIKFTGVLGNFQNEVLKLLVADKRAILVKPAADTIASDAQ